MVDRLLATGLTRLWIGGGRFGLDPALDQQILSEVRSAAGPDVELAIDLVTRWKNFHYAREQAEALAEFGLAWFEEPISSEDTVGLRRLSEAISTKLSGGENLTTYAEFDHFTCSTGRTSFNQTSRGATALPKCEGSTNWRRGTAPEWSHMASARASCWRRRRTSPPPQSATPQSGIKDGFQRLDA